MGDNMTESKSNLFLRIFLNGIKSVEQVHEKNKRFIAIWSIITITVTITSQIFMILFNENLSAPTFLVVVTIFLWPVIYLYLHKGFLKVYGKLMGSADVETIISNYMDMVKLKPFYTKILYIGFSIIIYGWVLLQGSFFNNAICYYGILVYFIPIVLVATYSLVLLTSIIISIYRLSKQKNNYKLYQYPSYSAFISETKRFNSRISYLLIFVYILVLLALAYSPFEFDNMLYIILSLISLFPLSYAVYSVYLQKIIINDAKQEKVVEYEHLVLEKLFNKVLYDPSIENINEYKTKVEFRDYLIKHNSEKNNKHRSELVVTILIALLPILWQAVTYFMTIK